jgi:DtxR family Mn-dependent transcriptional regulator
MQKSVKHTNDNELTHSMVHYLLTIHKLKETNGYARVTDIAKDLGLTKGSVSTALNNLKKRELVLEDDSKFLSLSDRGHHQVHRILSSRTLLFYFLRDFVGVSEEAAQQDSCLMEHLVSDETLVKFFEFLKKLSCSCDQGHSLDPDSFTTDLNICKFDSPEDFMKNQKGDSYLVE